MASSAISERVELLPKSESGGDKGAQVDQPEHARTFCRLGAVGALVSLIAVISVCALRQGQQPTAKDERLTTNSPVTATQLRGLADDGKVNAIMDKPASDARTYQHTVLPNGLKVLNVLDGKALQTAFAVAVRSGSFNDPVELPGLAHFCEHMLFLGTKKYPEASGFDRFMAANGGANNAYTASEVTVYYGEVTAAAGHEALDRFAGFFTDPMFSKKYVEKEVHAINSEHQKNTQNPGNRIYETIQSLASSHSPVSRFHTGDINTLFNIPKKNGSNPVDALKVYYQDNYCPSRMSLVTFGSEPLDEQLRLVKKIFGPIPKGSKRCQEPVKNYSSPAPFGPDQLGMWQVVQGTTPKAELWLMFPLPDLTKEYLSQPLEYLDYVVGYRGLGSLSYVLKDKLGLANSVDGSYDMSSALTQVFVVFSLTKKGAKNLELVMDVFFAYLAALKLDGIDDDLYQTIADVTNLKWNWTEPDGPSNTASDLAEAMTRLPIDKVLTGDGRIDKQDPSLVSSLLSQLAPTNMNVAFVDPHAGLNETKSVHGVEVRTLPHYDVKYTLRNVAEVVPKAGERWEEWLGGVLHRDEVEAALAERVSKADLPVKSAPFPEAPKPIKDVPREVNKDNMKAAPGDPQTDGLERALYGPPPAKLKAKVAEVNKSSKHILRPVAEDVWYRSGWVTTSPKVHVSVMLRPLRSKGEPDMSALDSLRLSIYSQLLSEEMQPKMVDLTATGVSYSIGVSDDGLQFSFGGFAANMPTLVQKVLEEFNRFNANLSITQPSRFQRVVRNLREDLSTYRSMPVDYAIHARGLLLSPGEYSRNETLAVLESVDLQSAVKAAGELMLSRPLKLTALGMGNLNEEENRAVVDAVARGIELPDWVNTTTGQGEVQEVMPVVDPKQPVELRMLNPRPGDTNDVAIVTIISGVATVESRVAFGLLGQILQPLAYEELRTQRQLGYVVSAGASSISNVQYISAVVQGHALGADDQEAAIELLYNELMPKRLANLSDEEFASIRHATEQTLLQPPVAPRDELGHFWGPVAKGGRCFSLQSALLDHLNSSAATKDTLVETWAELATPWKKGTRKKFVTKFYAGKVPERQADEEVEAAMKAQGVPEDALPMIMRERAASKVLADSSAAEREKLAKSGGFFPVDLHCGDDEKASS